MNRNRHARLAAGATIVTAVALATALKVRSEQASIDFRIVFDGGYVYNLGAERFIEIKSLDKGGHPLRIKLDRGQWSLGGIDEFKVHDADVGFWPDGNAPADMKPTLPPSTRQTGCDPDVDRKNPNNLFFLPDLGEPAKGMGTTMRRRPSPKRAASVFLKGGGTVSIRSVSGCVEYRKPNGEAYGEKRSMASGLGGVLYDWRVQATSITLRIASGGTTFNVVVKPDGNRIQLRIGDHETPPPMGMGPYKLKHFA